jgi:hypothetical protein
MKQMNEIVQRKRASSRRFEVNAISVSASASQRWRHVNAGSRARLRWMFTSASGVLFTFCLSVAHGLGAFRRSVSTPQQYF